MVAQCWWAVLLECICWATAVNQTTIEIPFEWRTIRNNKSDPPNLFEDSYLLTFCFLQQSLQKFLSLYFYVLLVLSLCDSVWRSVLDALSRRVGQKPSVEDTKAILPPVSYRRLRRKMKEIHGHKLLSIILDNNCAPMRNWNSRVWKSKTNNHESLPKTTWKALGDYLIFVATHHKDIEYWINALCYFDLDSLMSGFILNAVT